MSNPLWLSDGVKPFSREGNGEGLLSLRGVLHGWRVMTTMTAFGRTIIDLERHLDRLYEHAEQLGFEPAVRKEIVSFDLNTLLETLNAPKARCRVFFMVGEGPLGAPIGKLGRWVACDDVSGHSATEKPFRIKIVTENSWNRGPKIKTGLYDMAMGALPRAVSEGFDDILFSNSDQEIAEASASNIFLLGRDGDRVEIATPGEASGILLGITRRRMIELLTSARIPVTVRTIYRDEIPRFDEGFLTSSVRGLVPVSEISGHRLHTTRANSVFRHIERLWNTWVHTQLGYPVDWRTGSSI